MEGVRAGGEGSARGGAVMIGFRLLLVGEESHVVDLDLIAGARGGVFIPHGIQPEPVGLPLPGGRADGGSFIGVDGLDIRLRDVHQIGVPFLVLLQIDMDAACAFGTRIVELAEELNGVRPAEVPGPDLDPDQLGGVRVRHVDGDVRVVSRGGEGIVIVARIIRFSLPVDVVAGVSAHTDVDHLVRIEFPAERGLVLQAGRAVGGIPDLDGDALHVVEYRPDLDGAGVGAFALLPFDVAVTGQQVDEARIQLHRGGAVTAGDVCDPVSHAVGPDRLDPHEPGHLRAAEAGDGEIVPGVQGHGGIQAGVQHDLLIPGQHLRLRHSLEGEGLGRQHLDGELPLDGLHACYDDVGMAVPEAVMNLIGIVVDTDDPGSL